MIFTRITTTALILATLTGCTAGWDLQGEDPIAYYDEYPIKNRVEDKVAVIDSQFIGNATVLPAGESAKLDAALKDIAPTSVHALKIQLNPVQMSNLRRQQALSRWLNRRGYSASQIAFLPESEISRNAARFVVEYSVVVSPRCPDWRRSPVTTYSNTSQANFRCANTTNIGLMVADPKDLEGGSGIVSPDTETDIKAIQTYRNGGAATSTASSGASGESSSSAPQ